MAKFSRRHWRVLALVCAAAAVAACASRGGALAPAPSVPTARDVDLSRFMGDWYVIANIPTWPERDAYNAVENYSLREAGVTAVLPLVLHQTP